MEELDRVQRGQASSIGLLKKFNEIENNKDYKVYSPGRDTPEGSRVFSEEKKRFSHTGIGSDRARQESSAENNQPSMAGRPQDYRDPRNLQKKSEEHTRGSSEKKRYLGGDQLPRKSVESRNSTYSRDKLRPTLRAHHPVDGERPTVGSEEMKTRKKMKRYEKFHRKLGGLVSELAPSGYEYEFGSEADLHNSWRFVKELVEDYVIVKKKLGMLEKQSFG
jgi:hypothetical protein